jgi:hypothetical protein
MEGLPRGVPLILFFFGTVALTDATRFSPARAFFLCFWIDSVAKPVDEGFTDAA